MSHSILRDMKSVQTAKYYSVMVDESCDISVKEQVSLCFGTVTNELEIQENLEDSTKHLRQMPKHYFVLLMM